jgi:uncharacterized protein (TIGR02996 family)
MSERAPISDEQAALLAAVASEPDDDTPRLVYADWLDESGDAEQAEFIRDSIELSRLESYSTQRQVLKSKIEAAERANGRSWLEAIGITAFPEYHRGFPEDIYYLGSQVFLSEVDLVFRLLPVRALVIHAPENDALDYEGFKTLSLAPGHCHLRKLSLSCQYGIRPAHLRKLFRSSTSRITGLVHLSLADCGLGPDEAEILATSPSLAELTVLDLSDNDIEPRGARAILESPYLTRLREIWLFGSNFGYWDEIDPVVDALRDRFGSGLHLNDRPDEHEGH